jgi:hypothetical protein
VPRAILLALVGLVVLGCAGDRYSLRHTTAAGQASEVEVLGARPRIQVGAYGDGALLVELESAEEGRGVTTTLRASATQYTLPGPVLVRLTPQGDASVEWKVEAWGAAGLAADLIARPRGGPD